MAEPEIKSSNDSMGLVGRPEQEQKWQEVSLPTGQEFAAELALAAAAVATPSEKAKWNVDRLQTRMHCAMWTHLANCQTCNW